MKEVHLPKDSLRYKCLGSIVDDIDIRISNSYSDSLDEITEETKPDFGFVNDLRPPYILIHIIEELIVRKLLNYKHLKVLLPKETRSLTCDENTKFSPFQLDTIQLISKRCPNFEILHYHMTDEDKEGMLNMNILSESILRLKNLKKINLYDSKIESQTIRLITINCSELIELNLSRTNLTDEGLNYLHDEESVVKESLTTLIIDETSVSVKGVGKCLQDFQSLTHFQFDRTIESCFSFFENLKNSKTSMLGSEFNTTIFKSRMNTATGEQLVITQDFQQWLIEMFPKVEHLILISITGKEIPFVDNLIRSWKHISQLELSAQKLHVDELKISPNVIIDEDVLDKLKHTFEICSQNLISLKLERFRNVDILYLGETFANLEKLTLINNWILPAESFSPFKNLKEFEIAYCYSKNYFDEKSDAYDSNDENEPDENKPEGLVLWDLSKDAWRSLFSSENLKKIFIYNQYNFRSTLLHSLLSMDCLKNLKEFKVFYCPIKLDCIIQLFDVEIPVEKIVLGCCPFMNVFDAKEISTFIKSNYSVTFSITNEASEISCYLRWLLLNSEDEA